MEYLINERITELEKHVTNLREIIATINNEILDKKLVPDDLQKALLKHIANQGVKALKGIEKLKSQ